MGQLDLFGGAPFPASPPSLPEGDVGLYRARCGALYLVAPIKPEALDAPASAHAWRCYSYQRLDRLLLDAIRSRLRGQRGGFWTGTLVIPWPMAEWARVEPADVMRWANVGG